eukprot:3259217-Amphidinium_carterae.1
MPEHSAKQHLKKDWTQKVREMPRVRYLHASGATSDFEPQAKGCYLGEAKGGTVLAQENSICKCYLGNSRTMTHKPVSGART